MRACDIYADIRKFIDYQTRTLHPSMEIRMYLDESKTKEVSSFGFVGESFLSFSLWENEIPDARTLLLPPTPIPLWVESVPAKNIRGASRKPIGFKGNIADG